MPKASFKNAFLGFALILGVSLILLAGIFSLRPTIVHSQVSATPITGYAWSDNIGWISLNCSTDPNGCGTAAGNWGLSVLNGTITGYAWSDNIGWISANNLGNGCPSLPCTATMSSSHVLGGWLKALSADNKGWDGWISLSGTSPSYGVVASSTNACAFSGQAWGSDVVGWIDFSQAKSTVAVSDVYTCTNSNKTIVDTHTDASCNVTVTTTNCPSLSFCSPGSSVCLYTSPSGTLTVSPSIVQSGATVKVTWSIMTAQSCTVSGSNNDGTAASTDTASPGIWLGLNQTKVSSPITQPTTYTLSCVQDDPSLPPYTQTATVTLAPTFQEK